MSTSPIATRRCLRRRHRPGRRAGQQRRRRLRPGRPSRSRLSPARQWQEIFDVNVTGAFNFAQAVAPGMKTAGHGRIVNISSGAGLGNQPSPHPGLCRGQGGADRPDPSARPRARALRHHRQQRGRGLRAAPTRRPSWQWEYTARRARSGLVESIPLRRLGSPEDIAHAVLFFASDYAAWITGQVLSVSGGR